jgi:hypothetical protein
MPRNAAKTECIHGHPFDKANTRWTSRGQRDCRACGRARDLRLAVDPTYRARKRAQDRARPLDPAMRERRNAKARENYHLARKQLQSPESDNVDDSRLAWAS